MDSLQRHRSDSEDINITILSKILLNFAIDFLFLYFSVIFELIDLQGPMNFFRSCKYNTGPISKTKNGLEHISEAYIFKGMKFCLREKSFKSFSNECIFV